MECASSDTLPPLLTVAQVADRLNETDWRVRDMIRRHELPSVRVRGGRFDLVPPDALVGFVPRPSKAKRTAALR